MKTNSLRRASLASFVVSVFNDEQFFRRLREDATGSSARTALFMLGAEWFRQFTKIVILTTG